MISRETRQLVVAILAEARARGLDVEEESLVVEQSLPVLRLCAGGRVLRSARIRLPGASGSREPDVVTVHGAKQRSSKTWPRRLDGGFKIPAVVDHLLTLVREELESPRQAPPVAAGVAPAASGLHVLHAATLLLGVMPRAATPGALVERLSNETVRNRIEARLGRGGLTDGDLRAIGHAVGLFVSRCMTWATFDPFEPAGGDLLSVLRLGLKQGGKTELRYVLLVDRRGDRVKLADPAGKGVVEMKLGEIEAAWKLGAAGGRGWLGTISRARGGR